MRDKCFKWTNYVQRRELVSQGGRGRPWVVDSMAPSSDSAQKSCTFRNVVLLHASKSSSSERLAKLMLRVGS